jgi:catechol 2,3-dioxygenase-like lactoylglutathione lyase family enzyme
MIPAVIADIDLDHVAVAAEQQRDAYPRYAADLAGRWISSGDSPGFTSAQLSYANGMKVELLSPFAVEQNDFLRRFLDRNGPGPHHLTFKVKDIVAALDEVEAAGLAVVGVDLRDPMWKEAFVHPKAGHGIVVQLAQSGGADWSSPAPAELPPPRTPQPATLLHVAHAVPAIDAALELFAGLLAGRQVDSGADGDARWVELAWPGPGRVRLLEPVGRSSSLHDWLEGRPGRLHHLAFTTEAPGDVAGARPAGDGEWEVAPGDNLGVRLRLRDA